MLLPSTLQQVSQSLPTIFHVFALIFILFLTGHLYVKSDVYGFGVVLLEMLTGLRAHDSRRPNGQQNLVDWVRPIISKKRKLKTIMDARMEGQYSSKAALVAAQLTLRCLEAEPRKRPSMKEVVEELEQVAAIGKPKQTKTNPTHSTSSSYQHGRSPGAGAGAER